MTIHWCGTGLSSIPGLRRLLKLGAAVQVWNRSTDKAHAAVGDLTGAVQAFSPDALAASLAEGDILVSMLPGDFHVPLATLCVERRAHFVSSSYIAPEMRALDAAAREAGVALVNEVGLDPGIDHLMAHRLVAQYRAGPAYDPDNVLSFTSYCGGVPKIPNDFRYKFSWSPLGVLKALRAPSRSIKNFEPFEVTRPWDAITEYLAPLTEPEIFEAYPNRDSLPFMADYQFKTDWRVKEFVRGTLRLAGWQDAWRPVFEEIDSLSGATGDARLQAMADAFWQAHAYAEDEPDRVVLCVSLKAERENRPVWHRTYALDAWGDERGSAMARLVSNMVALAVGAVGRGQIGSGVSAAPSAPALVDAWLADINGLAQSLVVVDHTHAA